MWKKQVQMHDVDEDDDEFKPIVLSGYVVCGLFRMKAILQVRCFMEGRFNWKEQKKVSLELMLIWSTMTLGVEISD